MFLVSYQTSKSSVFFKHFHQAIGYLLINGSTTSNMKQRIESLVRLLQEEKLIVFLTGERDLFESEKRQTGNRSRCCQYPSLTSNKITFISASKNSSGVLPQKTLPQQRTLAELREV